LFSHAENAEATKIYYLSKLKLNWVESQLTCKSYGLNLLSIDSSDEFAYIRSLYLRNDSIFESHTYIGATNLFNESWYWIGSGKKVTLNISEWLENGPNGQHKEEFCTDIFQQPSNKSGIFINDVPCRSTKYLWDFLCERFEKKEKIVKDEKDLFVVAIFLSFLVVSCAVVSTFFICRRQNRNRSDREMMMFKLIGK
jgi:hypothetical protein